MAIGLNAADTLNICWLGSSSRGTTPGDVVIFGKERGIPVRQYYAPKTTSWKQVLGDTLLMDTIRSGVFDYVAMMALFYPEGDHEKYYLENKDEYLATAQQLADSITAAGSIPVLWMRRTIASAVSPLVYDEETMTWSKDFLDTLNELHYEVVEPATVYAAPVAVGSQVLVKNGFRVISDETHPTDWQSYLAACVWGATLFRENPTGRIANPNPLVDSVTAHFIQQVAWNVSMDERMKSNLPPWHREPIRVKQIDLSNNISSIERYLTFKINVDLSYENDSVETGTVNAVYASLTPSKATVDFFGNVAARETGRALIEVWRETERETLSIDIVSSTAVLDSVVIMPKQITGYVENGFKFTAYGYFSKEGQHFSINLDGAVKWIPSDDTQFKVTGGYLERVGAEGGNMVLVIEKDGFRDSVAFTMPKRLSVLKRLNFQPYDTLFNSHWESEWNRSYDSTRGYGWLTNKPVKDCMTISRNNIDFYDSLFITSTACRPGTWSNWAEGRFKFGIPDGDYIVKMVVGQRLSGYPCMVRIDDDPLINKISGNRSDTLVNFITSKSLGLVTTKDTIELRTDNGLYLNITGFVSYIIIASKEGVDIDSVAYDTKEAFSSGGSTHTLQNTCFETEVSVISAFPNPFNPTISISFHGMPDIQDIGIYDANGRKVADLTLMLNKNGLIWNANRVPSGVYFVKAISGNQTLFKKVMLMR
jgi:hypothetical protein